MKQLKKWAAVARRYPLSTALIVVIWVLCLTPWIPETPLSQVSLIDKWTHLVMYGTLTATIWWEYLRQHPSPNIHHPSPNIHHPTPTTHHLFLLGFLAPIAMGGLVELAQAYCTAGHRSGEWLDFAANSLGVVLGTLVGLLMFMAKRHKI